jgi:hypothetical protein
MHPDAHISAAVERANRIWASAGVEFWIRSIERYDMPHLHRYVRDKPTDAEGCPNGSQCFTWDEVKDELHQVLHNMPPNAYPDGDDKSAAYWLHAASALYADPNEVIVWLVDEYGSSGNGGPETGRMVYVRRNGLWADEIMGPNTTLAHELGHFLGLMHNNDSSVYTGYDHCDRWDLVFTPGNPNVFFPAANNPLCAPGSVRYIAKEMSVSADTPFGPVRIVLNGQEYTASGTSADPEIKGLYRATGEPHDPPESWGFTMNVMGGIAPDNIDGTIPRFFSESQVAMMSDFLSRDVSFSPEDQARWKTDAGQVPVGAIAGGLTSLRTSLGKEFHAKIIGAPVAVSQGPGRLDVFVRAADTNHLWHKQYNSEGWSHWRDLGGRLTSQPAAVSWGLGRLDVFVRGFEGQLAHKRYATGSGWSEWRDLGGRLTSQPAAASWGPGRLDVFVRGFEGQLAHKRYASDAGWSEWRDLGGRLTSAPTAVSWGPDRLDVFVRGFEGQLAHKRYSGDLGWSEWRDLGGRLTSAPAAVSWGPGRIDVFVAGFEGQLAHKRYANDAGWSEWRDLGGRLTSAPAAVSWGPDRLDVFVRGFEGQLAHKRYSGDQGWSEWRDLGGRLTSGPAAVSWGLNRLDVFVSGFAEKPATKRYSVDQGWSDWRKF